jgi:hypothetical protein
MVYSAYQGIEKSDNEKARDASSAPILIVNEDEPEPPMQHGRNMDENKTARVRRFFF